VLEEAPVEEADAWFVLRGLLQGLSHIHAQVGGVMETFEASVAC
jgi:hypothetical protein